MEVLLMGRSGLKIRDSKGFENQAKENFILLNKLFVKYRAQLIVAQAINLSTAALSGYQLNGAVSVYTSTALADLFGVSRDIFNGKKQLTKNDSEYQIIENAIIKFKGIDFNTNEQQSNTQNNSYENIMNGLKEWSRNRGFYSVLSESQLKGLQQITQVIADICKNTLDLNNFFGDDKNE